MLTSRRGGPGRSPTIFARGARAPGTSSRRSVWSRCSLKRRLRRRSARADRGSPRERGSHPADGHDDGRDVDPGGAPDGSAAPAPRCSREADGRCRQALAAEVGAAPVGRSAEVAGQGGAGGAARGGGAGRVLLPARVGHRRALQASRTSSTRGRPRSPARSIDRPRIAISPAATRPSSASLAACSRARSARRWSGRSRSSAAIRTCARAAMSR